MHKVKQLIWAGGILALHYSQSVDTDLETTSLLSSSKSALLEFHILRKWVHGSSGSESTAMESFGTLAVQAWAGLLTCRYVTQKCKTKGMVS